MESTPAIIHGLPVHPYGKHCVVKRLPMPSVSKGGIAHAEDRSEKNYFCRLLAKGNGELCPNGVRKPSTLANVGDLVVVRQFEGRPIFAYDKDHLLVEGETIELRARVKHDAN